MNRIRCWVLVVLANQLLFTPVIAQGTHVIEAPNFLGKNLCMKVDKPAVRGLNYSQVAYPSVQMETELGHREADYLRNAKYTITLGNLGAISIDEELATASTCTNLPLDSFVWQDEPDGLHSTAKFCLTGADGKRKVRVQGSVLANGASLASVKSALVGVAACRMSLYPSQYDSRDVYANKEPLLLGPYVLARSP